MTEQNFIALCVAGKASAEQIDDFVARWHNGELHPDGELIELLGMDDEEYARWMCDPDQLAEIIESRRRAALRA